MASTREEFEKKVLELGQKSLHQTLPGIYDDPYVRAAWEGWQARAAYEAGRSCPEEPQFELQIVPCEDCGRNHARYVRRVSRGDGGESPSGAINSGALSEHKAPFDSFSMETESSQPLPHEYPQGDGTPQPGPNESSSLATREEAPSD